MLLLQPETASEASEAGIGSKSDKDELMLGLRLKFNGAEPAAGLLILLLIAAKAQSSKASAMLLSMGSLADVST